MNFDERIRVHILQSCFILFKISVMLFWNGRKFDKIFLPFAYVYLYLFLVFILYILYLVFIFK